MGRKSSTQCERFFTLTRQLTFSDLENFSSANYSKFAVECDFSKRIKFGCFFEKLDVFFEKKLFLKIPEGGKLAVECVSNDIIS